MHAKSFCLFTMPWINHVTQCCIQIVAASQFLPAAPFPRPATPSQTLKHHVFVPRGATMNSLSSYLFSARNRLAPPSSSCFASLTG